MKAVCYSLSFLDGNNVDPTGYVRLVAPFREAGIELIPGLQGNKVFPENVSMGDIVVIQRHFPTRYLEYQKVVEQARAERKPIVFEIDDYLFCLPEKHPDRLTNTFTPSLLPMFQAVLEADAITVPTGELKNALLPFNKNVIVLPNFLDDHLWHIKQPGEVNSTNERVTIGYMGTNSHQPDIEMVVPALTDILKCYGQKVSIHFWGTRPPDELRTLVQVEWTPWYSYCYQDFAEYFQTQKADIFIAPLRDNFFNRCKSPLKFFEYSALGVPGVYSAILPYSNVIKHKKEGMLAGSLNEWKESLEYLLDNADFGRELAINSQKLILKKYLLTHHAHLWAESYQRIVRDYQNKKNSPKHPVLEVIAPINLQVYGLLRDNEIALEELRSQNFTYQQEIEALNSQVNDYLEEILSYAMSRSWRVTRPFRKLNKSISRLLNR